jgi:hypothetical protein
MDMHVTRMRLDNEATSSFERDVQSSRLIDLAVRLVDDTVIPSRELAPPRVCIFVANAETIGEHFLVE